MNLTRGGFLQDSLLERDSESGRLDQLQLMLGKERVGKVSVEIL